MTVTETTARVEHVDVLIVGAGLSGIGAGHHLQANCPGKSYAILEAREAIGGTWDLFRYPGIRSDSDMYTLGYSFRPWKDAQAIADGPSILEYVRDTARDGGIDRRIRFNHRVVNAEWSSADARWSVEAERSDTGETVRLTCGFLFMCTGYYRYDEGYTPDFAGTERFAGPIVHPQHWPERSRLHGKASGGDRERRDRRDPRARAGRARGARDHAPALTELHRRRCRRRDPVADLLRERLPAKLAYSLLRWKNVTVTTLFYQLSRRFPRLVKAPDPQGRREPAARRLRRRSALHAALRPLGSARVPGARRRPVRGALKSGRASIVTDEIETFTERGLRLASGDGARGRPDRHRHRAEPAGAGRHASSRSTAARSSSPRPSATRA